MVQARRGRFRETGVSLALVLAIAFVGTTMASSDAQAAGVPTIRIVSPADNAVIGNGSPITIVFNTTNLNLTDPGTGGGDPNAGHVEVFVDGTLFELTSDTTLVLPLGSGTHGIRLRLVADNGTGFTPDVSASVTVTSTTGPAIGVPAITITYPRNGQQRGPDTAVSFQLANFSLVPPGGPPNVPNEGHIEVYLDGTLYQELSVYEPAHFSDLSEGDHTATLQLVDNAHNPLTPDVSASVDFHVRAPGIFDISPELALINGILAGVVVLVLYYTLRRKTP